MSTADRCPNCGEKIMEHRIVEGTREGSTLYICKTVPRVAESADDLQVGQAVAVRLAPENWRVGMVRRDGHGQFICDRGNDNGLVLFGWMRHRLTVIILAEPEPPEPEMVEVPQDLISAAWEAADIDGIPKGNFPEEISVKWTDLQRLIDAIRALNEAVGRP